MISMYIDEWTPINMIFPNNLIYPDYNDYPFEHLNGGGSFVGYAPADTQLTVRAADVLQGSFYGINGVETGTLGKTTDLTINEAKSKMLGVILDEDGTVSENCAQQMAKGLYNLTKSDIFVK